MEQVEQAEGVLLVMGTYQGGMEATVMVDIFF
jgi:hypothetical protein